MTAPALRRVTTTPQYQVMIVEVSLKELLSSQPCVCNYPTNTVCPQYCPAPYTPTPNPARK